MLRTGEYIQQGFNAPNLNEEALYAKNEFDSFVDKVLERFTSDTNTHTDRHIVDSGIIEINHTTLDLVNELLHGVRFNIQVDAWRGGDTEGSDKYKNAIKI